MKWNQLITVLLVLGWVLFSGWLETRHYQTRAHSVIREKTAEGKRAARDIARRLGTSIGFYHGIPVMLAENPQVLAVLAGDKTNAGAGPSLAESGATNYPAGNALQTLDDLCYRVKQTLGPDIVWIMDATGLCIAASDTRSGPTRGGE